MNNPPRSSIVVCCPLLPIDWWGDEVGCETFQQQQYRRGRLVYLLGVKTPQVGWNHDSIGQDVVHHLARPHGPGKPHVTHGDRGGAQGEDVRALRGAGVAAEVNKDANSDIRGDAGGGGSAGAVGG